MSCGRLTWKDEKPFGAPTQPSSQCQACQSQQRDVPHDATHCDGLSAPSGNLATATT